MIATETPDEPTSWQIEVLGSFVQTTISLESGTKITLLGGEKDIVRLVMGYRAALSELRGIPAAKMTLEEAS